MQNANMTAPITQENALNAIDKSVVAAEAERETAVERETVVEHIWLKSYPAGVPAEINADSYSSINDVFDQACAKYRNSPGFTCMGKSLTYGELDELAKSLAAY